MTIKAYHGTGITNGRSILSTMQFINPKNNKAYNLYSGGIYFYDQPPLSEQYIKRQIPGGSGYLL